MNVTKPEKKFIFLLKLACDTDLGPKILAAWSMTILARSANYSSSAHSRPQSPSFLGHLIGKRGALEAAVIGCQKISDIRSHVQKLQISLLMLITDFCPSLLHWGKNFTSWALSREWLLWDVLKMHHFTQLGFTDNLELKEEDSNRNRLNTLLVCRTETINRQTIKTLFERKPFMCCVRRVKYILHFTRAGSVFSYVYFLLWCRMSWF